MPVGVPARGLAKQSSNGSCGFLRTPAGHVPDGVPSGAVTVANRLSAVPSGGCRWQQRFPSLPPPLLHPRLTILWYAQVLACRRSVLGAVDLGPTWKPEPPRERNSASRPPTAGRRHHRCRPADGLALRPRSPGLAGGSADHDPGRSPPQGHHTLSRHGRSAVLASDANPRRASGPRRSFRAAALHRADHAGGAGGGLGSRDRRRSRLTLRRMDGRTAWNLVSAARPPAGRTWRRHAARRRRSGTPRPATAARRTSAFPLPRRSR